MGFRGQMRWRGVGWVRGVAEEWGEYDVAEAFWGKEDSCEAKRGDLREGTT